MNDDLPTIEEVEEMDNEEVLDLYMEQNNLYRTEGTQGVDNLRSLCAALGYDRNGQYIGSGHELINFLADNSGAVEALMEFVREHADSYENINDDMRYEIETRED